MSAHILDGRALSKALKADLKREVDEFQRASGVTPTLAVLRVGEDSAGAGYARAIAKNCAGLGLGYRAVELHAQATQAEVDAALHLLNCDGSVHGIMVLEPLPEQIDGDKLLDGMLPRKDVDGVHPDNAGRLAAQRPPYFVPATPAGGMALLEAAEIDFRGKHAVIVGRSDIVGKPMALLLLHRHCTVTIAHSRTQNLDALCSSADILCVAVGRPEMVSGAWVKPGAVVVDFGTTYTDDGLKGDCEQESVDAVAGMRTPVPGGTGPVTNVMLMRNVLTAARRTLQS